VILTTVEAALVGFLGKKLGENKVYKDSVYSRVAVAILVTWEVDF
jgi:hypothetical protein